MKILVLAPYYPHRDDSFSGIFNERCVATLSELCDSVEVLVPRPYAPPVLSSLVPRWKAYSKIVGYEVRNGIPVYRPTYLQIPRVRRAFWIDPAAFYWCRHAARKMHRRVRFDAIVSFDLIGVGGIAWRMGQDLGIPASGWAVGGDVRFSATSSYGQALLQAIKHLDLVFYQSYELLEKVAELLRVSPHQMSPCEHVVLPRGVPEPPSLSRGESRNRLRAEWRISNNQIVVLTIGRIVRDKGIFELLNAISLAASRDPRIMCVLVGSQPAFDETALVQRKLDEMRHLRDRVLLLPACNPDRVWHYLCAADIFAFPSHEEGMPNSLLEAMIMGIPAIAFAIPPVREIEAGTGALITVPTLNTELFSEAILRLAASPAQRIYIGERGRSRVMDRFMVQKNMAEVVERLAHLVRQRRTSSRGETY